jgi:hypothetical protein
LEQRRCHRDCGGSIASSRCDDSRFGPVGVAMRDMGHVDAISDEMRAVVESEWPELAH